MPPVRARDLLLGSGPRLARDAFGPMLVFYVGWRLWGLVLGIVAVDPRLARRVVARAAPRAGGG